MRLKLASRKSDLARWQAVQVARVLEQHADRPSVEYFFKASLGDQNLDVPLASMQSKGVFTEDFYEDLSQGRCDLVVHSWKDLPVEERADTHIAMTLPRADMRDILLVPEEIWQDAVKSGTLKVLTSSPRRVYNLSSALPNLLPADIKVEFVNVRGNVPTRLQKMRAENAALILAKAGLDRLLQAEAEGFLAQKAEVRSVIQGCRFQVLPLSLNPPAAAQGALAVEVAVENETVNALCSGFTDERTFTSVRKEREILRQFGGGCHQKIGVAILERDYGQVKSLRGLTDDGQVLNEWKIESNTPWPRAENSEQIFPLRPKDNQWFDRVPVQPTQQLANLKALFMARAEAWPKGFHAEPHQVVWAAGVKTWQKLAAQGHWVNGCSDGLGDQDVAQLQHLVGPIEWSKLTHQMAGGQRDVVTYHLKPLQSVPNLKGKTHFFWMSGTSFEQARKHYPEIIAAGRHSCGPGQTYNYLKQQSLAHPVKVFIDQEQFLRETLP